MKKKLDFMYPFAGYTDLDFINCFTCTYMYLQDIKGIEEYNCKARDGKSCNGCGNCNSSMAKKQEDLFFFFGTMSGCNSLRCSFDVEENKMQKSLKDTDNVIEFVMGLSGYVYIKITNGYMNAIKDSIDLDKPILAKMKDSSNGSFRVIIGYDDGNILCPEPTGAQRKPDRNPDHDEIDCLYVFTGKIPPKYGLLDGLKRIKNVMDYNNDMGLWDEYIRKFNYWDEKLAEADFEELKRRFKRVSDTMWYTFNCHNFAETFRHKVWGEMKEERFSTAFEIISGSYDLTHTRAWQVIAINDCRDWQTRRYNELEWGMCATIMMCIESIKQNDTDVLNAIKSIIS